MPFLYTRIAILVVSICSSTFVLANPVLPKPVITPVPPTPANLPAAIEPLAEYVPQVACDLTLRPGTVRLAHLLTATYRADGATSWSSRRDCFTGGTVSEHYDGRAIDWMVSVRDIRQHAAALAAIRWLLASDSAGNRFAMARRLGIMYLIYDNRMWGAWDGTWEPYGDCAHERGRAYDDSCHRSHVHISLGWNGAMGRTTYWTGRVSPTDYGPCRSRDLNWAPRYRRANPSPWPPLPGRPRRDGSIGHRCGARAVLRRPGAARVTRPGGERGAARAARQRVRGVRRRDRPGGAHAAAGPPPTSERGHEPADVAGTARRDALTRSARSTDIDAAPPLRLN